MDDENLEEKRSLGYGLGTHLSKIDMFDTPIPGFNINGKGKLRTAAGGLISFVILYVSLMFASLKFMHLLQKHNP